MNDEQTTLTNQQLHFFKTFGYLLLRRFLTTPDLDRLSGELKAGLAAQYPPERDEGAERLWTRMTDESTPFAAALMEDPRFLTPAQQICGEDVLGIIDANRYVADTSWHPDTGDETQIAVKYIFYLDPLDAATGALRVIPGSHLLRGTERQAFAEAVGKVMPHGVPSQVITTRPGDVIAFDIRTWHASCEGGDNRRAWNLDYFRNPKSCDEIQKICALGLGHARSIQHFKTRRQYNYSHNWLDNPQNSTVRQRWIERLDGIGYLDQPGVGEPALR